MGWDTGPPVWPYESSSILLQGINAPAYALDLLLFLLLGVRNNQARLLVELPTILIWWWFIGWRIDFGLLPRRDARKRGVWGTGLAVLALGFWSCIAYLVVQQVRLSSDYGETGWRGPILFLLRNSGILCWCFLLALLGNVSGPSTHIFLAQREWLDALIPRYLSLVVLPLPPPPYNLSHVCRRANPEGFAPPAHSLDQYLRSRPGSQLALLRGPTRLSPRL